MSRPSGRLAGTVRWAVVPYSPRPPFRLYAGEEQAPVVVSDVARIFAAAMAPGGDAELTYLVPGKVRPVLILNEPPNAHHQEVTALRLLRLSRLSRSDEQRVREQREELLFYLMPERVDLLEENAAIVSALVRLHVEAIASGPSVGALDANEMRALGERVIRFYQFDTRLLLQGQIRDLATRHRAD